MSALPEGIDRLPSGKYRARVKGYGSRSFTRQRDAEKWRHETLLLKETGQPAAPKAITLAELAAEHLRAEHKRLEANTYIGYRNVWAPHLDERILGDEQRQWRHSLVDKKVTVITARDVESWRDERIDDHEAGPTSIRKAMWLLQAVMDRAVRDGYVARNVVKDVKKPKAKRKKKPRPITPQSAERLRAELLGPDGELTADAMFVGVLAYTGMRPGEARGLQWGDVLKRTIYVERAVAGTDEKPTKTERERNVRLVPPLADDLKAWRKLSGEPADDAWVFPRSDGDPWRDTDYRNWRKRKFKVAAERGDVPINNPYDLRHSAASLWLHEGYNIVRVASWLGHSASECLKTYQHVLDDLDPLARFDAAELIESARRDALVTPRGVQGGPSESRQSAGKGRDQGEKATTVGL